MRIIRSRKPRTWHTIIRTVIIIRIVQRPKPTNTSMLLKQIVCGIVVVCFVFYVHTAAKPSASVLLKIKSEHFALIWFSTHSRLNSIALHVLRCFARASHARFIDAAHERRFWVATVISPGPYKMCMCTQKCSIATAATCHFCTTCTWTCATIWARNRNSNHGCNLRKGISSSTRKTWWIRHVRSPAT